MMQSFHNTYSKKGVVLQTTVGVIVTFRPTVFTSNSCKSCTRESPTKRTSGSFPLLSDTKRLCYESGEGLVTTSCIKIASCHRVQWSKLQWKESDRETVKHTMHIQRPSPWISWHGVGTAAGLESSELIALSSEGMFYKTWLLISLENNSELEHKHTTASVQFIFWLRKCTVH